MLSPLWLFICLLEAPEGIYAVFWFGLVTGASKQERKKKPINESKKTHTKCEKKLQICFLCCNLFI